MINLKIQSVSQTLKSTFKSLSAGSIRFHNSSLQSRVIVCLASYHYSRLISSKFQIPCFSPQWNNFFVAKKKTTKTFTNKYLACWRLRMSLSWSSSIPRFFRRMSQAIDGQLSSASRSCVESVHIAQLIWIIKTVKSRHSLTYLINLTIWSFIHIHNDQHYKTIEMFAS